jgi:hypothetical protein
MERLVAQEIDAVKLVAEALAGGERGLLYEQFAQMPLQPS